MYTRLTEVIPAVDSSVITSMETLIKEGNHIEAAKLITNTDDFYNVGLKNFAKSFTDSENSGDIKLPINDMSATIIGFTKDNLNFSTILSEDIFYRYRAGTPVNVSNNVHYESNEDNNVNLRTDLVQDTQSSYLNINESRVAGLLTTRGFAVNGYEAGTNRAAINNIMNQFLCHTMEQVQDSTRPTSRVGKDVFLVPNPSIPHLFKTRCQGCHGLMDGLRGAFAYYNYNGTRLTYINGTPDEKYNINSENNPTGYETVDDSWISFFNHGVTSDFGVSLLSGNGAKSLGISIASSRQFSNCMSEKVFEKICLKKPRTKEDKLVVEALARDFEDNDYKMKSLFEKMSVHASCIGEIGN